MSELGDLQMMAEMVGFRYANCAIDTVSGRVTLACEDYDGNTLTAEGANLNDAMSGMMARLGAIIEAGQASWRA
jgi:hypothetical protein